jgi:hypothetical protein
MDGGWPPGSKKMAEMQHGFGGVKRLTSAYMEWWVCWVKVQ